MLCHRSVQQGNRINSMYLFYLHSLRVEQPTMIANPGQNVFLLQHKMNETIMCRCKHNALPLFHLNMICARFEFGSELEIHKIFTRRNQCGRA